MQKQTPQASEPQGSVLRARREISRGRRNLTKTGRKQDLGAGLAAVKMRVGEQYRPQSAPECLGARAADGVASSAGAEGGRASPALGQRANATSLRLFQLLTSSADRARPTHAGAGSLVSLLRPCKGSANAETPARPEITGSPVSIWASARQAAARGACLAGGGRVSELGGNRVSPPVSLSSPKLTLTSPRFVLSNPSGAVHECAVQLRDRMRGPRQQTREYLEPDALKRREFSPAPRGVGESGGSCGHACQHQGLLSLETAPRKPPPSWGPYGGPYEADNSARTVSSAVRTTA